MGYFKNAEEDSNSIQCIMKGIKTICKELDNSRNIDNCKNVGIGKLIESEYEAKICLDGSNSIEIFKNDLTEFSVIPASLFNIAARSNEYYIITRGITDVIPDTSSDVSNKFFLYNNKILYCDNNSLCTYISRNGFYLVTIDSTENQLVKCIDNQCSPFATTSFASGSHNFIDEIDFINKYKKIITCTSTGCTSDDISSRLVITDNLYFVDGSITPTDKIIYCTKKDGCKIVEGSPEEGQAYIDANNKNNVIICYDPDSGCQSVSGTDVSSKRDLYINAGNTSQIINCQGSECLLITSEAEIGRAEYFPVCSGSTDKLYVCQYNIKYKIPLCKQITTTNDNKFNVFLNSLFGKSNGDITRPLIRCDESGKCKPEDVNITNSEKLVFLNSDTDNVEPFKDDLIECSNKNGLDLTCSITSGDENQVFLNGNFNTDGNTKQIILCSRKKGCMEEQTNSSNNQPLYYINAGSFSTTDKLKDTLIKCEDYNKACSLIEAENGEVYINAINSAHLIHCYTKEGCINIPSKATDKKIEVYLNSSDLKTSGQKLLDDDLIKCKMNEGVITCSPATGLENEVYLNSNNSTEIILCTSDGCFAKTSTAKEDQPEFYINSNVEPVKTNIDSKRRKNTNNEISSNTNLINDNDIELSNINLVNDTDNELSNTILINDNDIELSNINLINDTDNEFFYMSSVYDTDNELSYTSLINENESFNTNLINDRDHETVNMNLIRCRNNGHEVICEIITAQHGDVYINANDYDTTNNPLIICEKEKGCQTNISQSEIDTLPTYYVNSGSAMANRLNDTLIKCSNESLFVKKISCAIEKAEINNVYINYSVNNPTYPLIKCNNNGCKPSTSGATLDNKEYYINSGDIGNKALNYDMIECSFDLETITCQEIEDIKTGIYLNSNYEEKYDQNQLIQCSDNNECQTIIVSTSGNNGEYYVNAGSDDFTNAIIFCRNKKCEKETPIGNSYYVGRDGSTEMNGLIECDAPPESEKSSPQQRAIDDNEIKVRRDVEKCTFTSSFSNDGYYLNSGYDKAVNQVIRCEENEGCKSEKVNLGYYLNIGDVSHPIIRCEKKGVACITEEYRNCTNIEIQPGDYCYEDGHLTFYPSSNSTGVVGGVNDDFYAFATIPANKFPGIRNKISTLFKVSRISINQISPNGIIMINKYGKLVKDLTEDQKDISVYECYDTTKMCYEKSRCTPDTYTYDPESRRAVFCNNGIYIYATFTGYVVDGNRVYNTRQPYLIHCENGSKCVSFKPNDTTYYINSGKDTNLHKLIHCSNNHCETVSAEIGNYVGQEGEGVINCSSPNYCTFKRIRTKMKFANSGSNKSAYGIISCTSDKGCVVAKAEAGYYLTYTNTILIECTSSTSCSEITPTVNYYNNADSQDGIPSIINCIQSRQDVICTLEETNRGYYITSSPKHLIHCRHGKKCKYINGENGIYRESLKKITSSSKRFNGNENDLVESKKVHSSKRDSGGEEDFGIIRCVNGKCASLTEKELAEIPICEFSHNRCYVVQSKSTIRNRYKTPTSVEAGGICTNDDRSIFYFAIDDIAASSDVIFSDPTSKKLISDKINCLEVNDSYSDNFFTVGPKIYRLNEDCVLQFYEPGYYFINTYTNTLVSGKNINLYNDKDVLLYRCDGIRCNIMDIPSSTVYIADVNKRIIRYDIQSHRYVFAYDKDIICIYKNNQCTPNTDLNEREFCVTYRGELVLAKSTINNRESGECSKGSSMTPETYGYGKYLYTMDLHAARMVTRTGYYIVNVWTNTTITPSSPTRMTTSKNKNHRYILYGCQLSSCKIYEPKASTYYYDAKANVLLNYKNQYWQQPTVSSGYAYISLDPSHTSIYKFNQGPKELKLNDTIVEDGYYYTIDNEMYYCHQKEYKGCQPIEDTGYYFTQAGEVYYCVYDSEGIEPTECTKQNCVVSQYYAINDRYYRCEANSILVPVKSRTCSHDKMVVINYPLSLTQNYPSRITQAVENIKKTNNSTAIAIKPRHRERNYLESISGVFTNCTYEVEEMKSTFDLVCVHNYVTLDQETREPMICSTENLGYIRCTESEDNPGKCYISQASKQIYPSFKIIIFISLMVLYSLYHNLYL